MLIQRKWSKNLKTLDGTLAGAVEDAAVVTPLVSLVKMVLPKNLVTLPKSLVTVTIVIDVGADEEARVTLPANLATTKLKKQLKPLLFDETLVEVVEDAAVVTPLVNLVKTVSPVNLVTLPKSLVTVTIVTDVGADEEAREILPANLATTKELKKHLRPLFSDGTLVEVVEDAAVVTPLVNLVKTVLPKNLVTLLKSLVTVTIAIDVDADADEEARVILLANLATTTKKLKKQLLKPLFFDETLVEAVEDVAVVTPLVNLVKTVLPRNLVKMVLPMSLVTRRKSLVTAMIVGVDVAAEDADTEAREILLANLAKTKKLKKQHLKLLFCDETLVEAVEDADVEARVILLMNLATTTKKKLKKQHLKLLFSDET